VKSVGNAVRIIDIPPTQPDADNSAIKSIGPSFAVTTNGRAVSAFVYCHVQQSGGIGSISQLKKGS
jgi:hypothetical protein